MGESVDLEEITLINVFTVEAKDQRRLLESLTRATDGPVGAAPGCIGAVLLGSIDGSKVTMQSGWRSEAITRLCATIQGPFRSTRGANVLSSLSTYRIGARGHPVTHSLVRVNCSAVGARNLDATAASHSVQSRRVIHRNITAKENRT